jgi:hypothetical protein
MENQNIFFSKPFDNIIIPNQLSGHKSLFLLLRAFQKKKKMESDRRRYELQVALCFPQIC